MTYDVALAAVRHSTRMLFSISKAYRPGSGVPVQLATNMLFAHLEELRSHIPWVDPPKEPDLLTLPITDGEVVGCKALLLEIIRRAAYDWVLYRTSKVYAKRKLAEGAYVWLFKEGPGHMEWDERGRSGKAVTSLVAICGALELDITVVRLHIRRLTVKNVMSIGRPAEYRKQDYREYSQAGVGTKLLASVSDFDDLLVFDGLVDD